MLRLQSGILVHFTNSKILKQVLTLNKIINIKILHITQKINTSAYEAIHTTFMFTLLSNAVSML